MKDYSNLIPTSFGFILDSKIVGEEIHVYTPETKPREPQKLPLEWLSHINKRKENQYRLLIENRDIIKTYKIKQLEKRILPINFITGIATIILAVSQTWLCIPSLILALSIFLGSKKIISNIGRNFDREMDIIQAFFNNRQDIEELSQTDKNITAYLSKTAQKELSNNEKLLKEGTIDSVFNIDFMDKTKLKDLRKILSRYMISKDLLEEQVFVNPLQETKKSSKKRTRKKEKKQ